VRGGRDGEEVETEQRVCKEQTRRVGRRRSPFYGKTVVETKNPKKGTDSLQARRIEVDKHIVARKQFSELKKYMKDWTNPQEWKEATMSVADEKGKDTLIPDVLKRLYLLDIGEYRNAKPESKKQELKEAAKGRQLSSDIIPNVPEERLKWLNDMSTFTPRQQVAIRDLANHLDVFCHEWCDDDSKQTSVDWWQSPNRFPYKHVWEAFLPFRIPR